MGELVRVVLGAAAVGGGIGAVEQVVKHLMPKPVVWVDVVVDGGRHVGP